MVCKGVCVCVYCLSLFTCLITTLGALRSLNVLYTFVNINTFGVMPWRPPLTAAATLIARVVHSISPEAVG